MNNPDRDTAAYALDFVTRTNPNPEGIPAPEFVRLFFHLCDTATDQELLPLSLAYPNLVAAHRLMFSEDGINLLRALAHPTQT